MHTLAIILVSAAIGAVLWHRFGPAVRKAFQPARKTRKGRASKRQQANLALAFGLAASAVLILSGILH